MLLFSQGQIQEAVERLGQKIDATYQDHEVPLVLVGVLKGAFCFLADLARAIARPNVLIDFMEAGSYGNEQQSSGRVVVTKDVTYKLLDCDVVLVEDIVDTGLTASCLVTYLQTYSPNSLEVVALLNVNGAKKRAFPIKPKFVGFTLPPGNFVFGYGLDMAQKMRHLPDIYTVERKNHG